MADISRFMNTRLVEVPTYHTAKRLLARLEAMRQFERARD